MEPSVVNLRGCCYGLFFAGSAMLHWVLVDEFSMVKCAFYKHARLRLRLRYCSQIRFCIFICFRFVTWMAIIRRNNHCVGFIGLFNVWFCPVLFFLKRRIPIRSSSFVNNSFLFLSHGWLFLAQFRTFEGDVLKRSVRGAGAFSTRCSWHCPLLRRGLPWKRLFFTLSRQQ